MALRRFEDLCDDSAELPPGRGSGVQLGAPLTRELVVLRAAVVIGRGPPGFDPAPPFEAVQRRVERSLAHFQDGAGDPVQPLCNRPAVLWLERDGLQYQQVERALRQVHAVGHGRSLCASTRDYLITCRSTRGVVSTSDTASGRRSRPSPTRTTTAAASIVRCAGDDRI